MDPDKMTTAEVWEVADGYKRERDAALLKLEAMRISHPTDICECRFNFADGVMTRKNTCEFHGDIESRLDKALVFVDYIAKRYEQGWDDPITERFYNEAKAVLGADVERQSADQG